MVQKPLTCNKCRTHMHHGKTCITRAGHTLDEDKNTLLRNALTSVSDSSSIADVISTLRVLNSNVSLLQTDCKAIASIKTSVNDISKKLDSMVSDIQARQALISDIGHRCTNLDVSLVYLIRWIKYRLILRNLLTLPLRPL